MLTQGWWGTAVFDRGRREMQRARDARCGLRGRVWEVDAPPAMLQLRFGERGLNIVDHRNRNPDLLETSDRLGSGLRSECTLDQPS